MKKFISIFSVLLVVVFIAGCGGQKEEKVEEPQPAIEQAAQEPQPEETAAPETDTIAEASEKTAAEPTKADFSAAPLKGKVVSFTGLVSGGTGEVKIVEATKLAEKGQPIVLKTTDGRIYWVYNSDGSFAAKNLAKYAMEKEISVYGKAKKVSNLNVIVASKIGK